MPTHTQNPSITDKPDLSVLTEKEKQIYVLCNNTFYVKRSDLDQYLKILAKLSISK